MLRDHRGGSNKEGYVTVEEKRYVAGLPAGASVDRFKAKRENGVIIVKAPNGVIYTKTEEEVNRALGLANHSKIESSSENSKTGKSNVVMAKSIGLFKDIRSIVVIISGIVGTLALMNDKIPVAEDSVKKLRDSLGRLIDYISKFMKSSVFTEVRKDKTKAAFVRFLALAVKEATKFKNTLDKNKSNKSYYKAVSAFIQFVTKQLSKFQSSPNGLA
jgi:hypothetical protein